MNTDLSRFIQEKLDYLEWSLIAQNHFLSTSLQGPSSQSMRTIRNDATTWEIDLLLGDYPSSRPDDLSITGKNAIENRNDLGVIKTRWP